MISNIKVVCGFNTNILCFSVSNLVRSGIIFSAFLAAATALFEGTSDFDTSVVGGGGRSLCRIPAFRSFNIRVSMFKGISLLGIAVEMIVGYAFEL